MPFGDRLKAFREARGYTQDELAKMVGVAKTTITGYERGNRTPDVEKIKKLAKALGITGDDLLETGLGNKKAALYSSEAMEIARDFDTLDRHGRQIVRAVMDQEIDRMAELAEIADAVPEKEPKIINIFVNPSAAGPALGETGQACEPYELRPEDPQGAEYAVRIQGDSMEPDFPDGGIAFVNHDEMRDGDIGIFCVDGATVIKQWHYDRALGMTYLFSLNRARADADVVLTRSNDRGMVWQGRVITRKHYPIPGKF
ncbi:MAG: helix-turn-helix domain-containing protein [Clostridiales bacterium]|nr:helix-turn-helix domain-containing protein [Clostridiales bacterium]